MFELILALADFMIDTGEMIILTDLVFVLADLLAARWMIGVWQGGDADLFQILLYSAFLVYGLAVRAICRWNEFALVHERYQKKFPQTMFWLRLGHVAALLAIPILIFVASMNNEARGDDLLLTISFLFLPALSIFTILMAVREPVGERPTPRLAGFVARAGLIYAFAFFNTVVLSAGNDLALLMTKELATLNDFQATLPANAAWYFLIPTRLVFIALVFLPMRLWFVRSVGGSKREWLSLAMACTLILLNGIF